MELLLISVEAKNTVEDAIDAKPQAVDKNQLPKPVVRMDHGTAAMLKLFQEQSGKQAQSGNML